MINQRQHPKRELLLLTILKLTKGKRRSVAFEDVVVQALKDYPSVFHLRGYPKLPDSDDTQRRIYDLRTRGLVEIGSRMVTPTKRGLEVGKEMSPAASSSKKNEIKIPRYAETECSRIESTEGFRLFVAGMKNEITDSDFYSYLGTAARSSRNEVLGRLSTIEDVVDLLVASKQVSKTRKLIPDYHAYLLKRFADIIKHFRQKKS